MAPTEGRSQFAATDLTAGRVTNEIARAAGRQTLREIGLVDDAGNAELRAEARELLEALGLASYEHYAMDRQGAAAAKRRKNPKMARHDGLLD